MKRTKKLIAWISVFALLLSGCSTAVSAEAEAEYVALMDSVAESFAAQETLSEWVVFDLAAYEMLGRENGENLLSDEDKTAYATAAADSVTSEYASAMAFAKAEIILNAAGLDSTQLENSEGQAVNNPENFVAIEQYLTYSDAVWALVADGLSSVTLSPAQISAAITKISENMNESGLLFGTYDGYSYDDPDSTGVAVGALARFVNEEDTYGANEIYGEMVSALSAAQMENGSYGNACTDAFVIIGLCAAGINPDEDARFIKGENSLIDGLMSYQCEGGFSGYDGSLDLEWSTEQGLRALVAFYGFEQSGDGAYDIYCAEKNKDEEDGGTSGGDNTEEDGETDEEEDDKTNVPSGTPVVKEEEEDEEDDSLISVTFMMKTHKKTWIPRHKVKVEEKTSVRDLISLVFDDYGAVGVGLNAGYLRSVTYDGESWGEFDAGPASGWQYYVNGSLPNVGISSYKLNDGDSVELVYTADYTKEDEDEEPLEEDKKEEEPAAEKEAWKNPFSDVAEGDWFKGSVQFVCEKNLMLGMSEDKFEPHTTLTRAMFVTVLYRMENSPEAKGARFSDVDENAWYSSAVAWASENGIVNGVSEGVFAPDAPITREQMAALVYRYASFLGLDMTAEKISGFSDAQSISPYAEEAVSWASSKGIMQGFGGELRPAAKSARCEACAVFERVYNLING